MVKRIANFIGLLVISIYGLAYYLDIGKLPRREKVVVEYILIALAILLVVETVRSIIEFRAFLRKTNETTVFNISFNKALLDSVMQNKQVIVVAITAVYIVMFPVIGFFATSFLYVLALNFLLGIRDKVQLFAVPTGLLIFVYVLFVVLFSVKLPAGLLI